MATYFEDTTVGLGAGERLKPDTNMARSRRRPTVSAVQDRDGGRPAVSERPTLLVFSADDAVGGLAAEAAAPTWQVEKCQDTRQAREALVRPAIRLIVVDDGDIEETARGWLLEQIRKYASCALVVYIASDHNPESERRARSYRVQYYTSKPLDHDRTLRVLQAFVKASG
jgi:DNA-binding NtrC family response regulator